MSDKINALKDLILNHPTLSMVDKEELVNRVESLSEEQLDFILPLVQEKSENLEKINEFFQAKKEVLASNDPEKIEAFLQEHYKKLWDEAQQAE
ncbi:MAG TPA: hypothetical protein PLH37_02245 [bacterium]|nr:hypothetical protein [bacterium]